MATAVSASHKSCQFISGRKPPIKLLEPWVGTRDSPSVSCLLFMAGSHAYLSATSTLYKGPRLHVHTTNAFTVISSWMNKQQNNTTTHRYHRIESISHLETFKPLRNCIAMSDSGGYDCDICDRNFVNWHAYQQHCTAVGHWECWRCTARFYLWR